MECFVEETNTKKDNDYKNLLFTLHTLEEAKMNLIKEFRMNFYKIQHDIREVKEAIEEYEKKVKE